MNVTVTDDRSCVAALDSMISLLRHDYPGWRDKIVGHEAAFDALVDSVRVMAGADAQHDVCIPALWRVRDFLGDPHIAVWRGGGPARAGAAGRSSEGSAAAKAPPVVAAALQDPNLPRIRRHDARTLVVVVPSLDAEYKRALDSLIAKFLAELLSTPLLVVDMRGNGGGCTCTYDALLPMIATGPIRGEGMDVWTSPDNLAHYRSLLSDDLPDSVKTKIREGLERWEAAPNQFVHFGRGEPDFTPATIAPMPSAVAVLVDSQCASSCEDFVLDARQSRKVTVFSASNTKGVHDYGNVRGVPLPGGLRMSIPTSRSRSLPSGAIDHVGLAPDVWIPRDSAERGLALEFVVGRIRRSGAAEMR